MNFNQAKIGLVIQKDYARCYDFYTKKLGLVPTWGDSKGPYTSFAMAEGEPNCFDMTLAEEMSLINGYTPSVGEKASDTVVITLPTKDIQKDYQKLKANGVIFLGEPQKMETWGGFMSAYFRDPEGNLFELNDGF
ncbi:MULTISPECIES: VOC family protein [Enterococcus]|uniref:VOC domain-containing protein n=1 Tax=Candidatus Enterococcus mangumiae TaxID=2230878 RepID=A0ABZ2SY44_9ENTE|nr:MULTISPECIES: VOC family protein [unclassified Enterococcus]MBO0461175.1 VOC family protein [Enterococcus sp. DIV1298c]MBO0490884.1 VOC family protein [Enterococcus sp. DIV1094]MBO1299885.1 VOC family protein [Enterococcus sp. DIV1271a]